MVHVRVAKAGSGEDVVPILWDDNYFSLLPGEKRTVSARFQSVRAGDEDLVLAVDGWNVAPASGRLTIEGKR
jgi:exo-1,4-beta-D-glucosaminidase